MQLYYDPLSTTSRPVVFFLEDQGVKVSRQVIELFAGQNYAADFTALNPNQMVPFLVDGDLRLGEGSAILKYLAETSSSPAYPAEPKARARVNAAMDWFNTQLVRDMGLFLVYPQVLPPEHLPPIDRTLAVAYGRHQAVRWLTVLDQHMLGDSAFVCGDQISLADYMGGAYVTLTELVGFDLTAWPNVCRWITALKARPAWARANAAFDGWAGACRAAAA